MDFTKNSNNYKLLYTSFNQTNDCVVFGTSTGFYVYTINPTFKKIIARKIPGGVSIVQMLFKSNIIIFVGNVQQGLYPKKKLIIWDDHKKSVIGEILFKLNIINIHVKKDIIIVVTLNKIYIYSFSDLSLIKSIETKNNPNGICATNYNDELSYLIYPGNNSGSINIIKIKEDYLKSISAHIGNIDYITISNNSKYVATCSKKGTLIRIFNLENFQLVKELRRGSDKNKIIDIKFSNNLKYLLCTSIKGTIHIFYTNLIDKESEINSNFGYGSYYLQNYLPAYFSSEWSFKQFHLKDIITNSIFTNNNELISIGNNGNYYLLSFKSNETKIINTFKFVSDDNDPFNDRNSTIK